MLASSRVDGPPHSLLLIFCNSGSIRPTIFAWVLAFVTVLFVPRVSAQSREVVTSPVDQRDQVELIGSVRKELSRGRDQGRVDAQKELKGITLSSVKTPAQQAALDKLIIDQQDPGSPDYHRWLTPEQFGERFGADPHDIDKLVTWLDGVGFSNIHVANGKNFVTFDGNVANAETSFGTEIHSFTLNGESHFANSRNIGIPAAFKKLVVGLSGLDDFYPKSLHRRANNGVVRPDFNNSSSTHSLTASDIQAIYDIGPLYTKGFTGAGIKLVIVGEATVAANDKSIAAYRALNGLSAINLQVATAPSDPPTSSAEIDESYIDIEVSGAVATGATIVYVATANAFNAARYAIDQPLGQIISMSFVTCESDNASYAKQVFENELQKAASEGITFIAGSGDTGTAGCDQKDETSAVRGASVTYPASSQYVTAVGGTELDESLFPGVYWGPPNANGGSALKYIPEKAWNDTLDGTDFGCPGLTKGSSNGIGCASGGGVSGIFGRPSWQVVSGVLSGKLSARAVPDLAFAASWDHDPYLICVPGYCGNGLGSAYPDGGTSATAPLFAGIAALLDQKLSPLDGKQGNLNPRIYTLAGSSAYKTVFNDVQLLGNSVPGQVGYQAGTGYDLVTGWGSVDANQFVSAFTGIPTISSWSVTPSSVALGSSIKISYTATDTGTGSGYPGSGLIRAELWRAPDSNGKPGTWAEVGSALSLSGSGPTPVTFTDSPATAGKYWYGTHLFNSAGDQANEPSSVLVTVTSAGPAISVTPGSLAFGSVAVGSSATQNLTVKNTGSGTLTGTVSVATPFSISSGGSYSLGAGASQTVTIKFSPTAAQTYSEIVTFTGGAGKTATVTGTGTQATTANLTATPTCSGSSPAVSLSFALSGGTESTFDVWRGGASISTGNKGATYLDSSSSLVAGKNYTYYVIVHLSTGFSVTSNTVNATAPATCTTGSGATITVKPSTLAFGPVAVGSSATQNFVVTNTGTGTLAGTASVSSPFKIVGGATYSLAPGASQAVAVSFTPGLVQSYSQSATFSGGSGATETVTGSGIASTSVNLSATPTCDGSGPEVYLSTTLAGGVASTFDVWRNGTMLSPTYGTSYPDFGGAMAAGQSYSYYVVMHLGSGANLTSNTVTVTAPTNCTVLATPSTATVPVGNSPYSIAVNSNTNKIYVANINDNSVTVINGADNSTTTISLGTNQPRVLAINSITNKIYVGTVSTTLAYVYQVGVIDGATNTVTLIPTPTVNSGIYGIAVNETTDTIYAVDYIGDLVVINGSTASVTSTMPGLGPGFVYPYIVVNPTTNQIYVPFVAPGGSTGSITIFDGATLASRTVIVGQNPSGIAVNPVTNQIYVADYWSGDVTIINGADYTTTTIPGVLVAIGNVAPNAIVVDTVSNVAYVPIAYGCTNQICTGGFATVNGVSNQADNFDWPGMGMDAVAVNSQTHKIYLANMEQYSYVTNNSVMIVDGTTNSSTSVTVGNDPIAIAINPATNKVYVLNWGSNNVTVIGP